MKGHTVTEETRLKIANSLKGKSPSIETRRKQSESLKGRRKSPETREKMRLYQANRNPDHNKNISRGMTGKTRGAQHAENLRKALMASGAWKPIGHTHQRNGYRWIKIAERLGHANYAAEHRRVVEQNIGRSLYSAEHVHHIDGDSLNNSLENLAVVSRRDHNLIHKLLLHMDDKLARVVIDTLTKLFPHLDSRN